MHFNALFVALLASAAGLFGQSSVWKISQGEQTLYLGGTCHVLRAQDFPLPAEFDVAFDASEVVFFESDIGRMQSPEMQQLVMREGMYHDGRTLKQALNAEAWQAVKVYCEQSGLPLEQAQQMKPWLFTIVMAMMELQKVGLASEGVDVFYYKRATAEGKKLGALETVEQQMAFLTGLGAGHESEMIAKTVAELAELPATMGAMLAAWRSGDLAKLDETILHDVRTEYPAIFQELIVERNQAWLPKLENLLATPEIEYVLVGAGHLAGAEGLIAQLADRGYAIEQVVAPATKR